MTIVTLEAQIACAERELKMREKVYARRVANGQMTPEQSAREILTMAAIVDTLKGLRPPDLFGA